MIINDPSDNAMVLESSAKPNQQDQFDRIFVNKIVTQGINL